MNMKKLAYHHSPPLLGAVAINIAALSPTAATDGRQPSSRRVKVHKQDVLGSSARIRLILLA